MEGQSFPNTKAGPKDILLRQVSRDMLFSKTQSKLDENEI